MINTQQTRKRRAPRSDKEHLQPHMVKDQVLPLKIRDETKLSALTAAIQYCIRASSQGKLQKMK